MHAATSRLESISVLRSRKEDVVATCAQKVEDQGMIQPTSAEQLNSCDATDQPQAAEREEGPHCSSWRFEVFSGRPLRLRYGDSRQNVVPRDTGSTHRSAGDVTRTICHARYNTRSSLMYTMAGIGVW